MSDISVALERIRSLERAAQTPYSGDAIAFMQVLSGHLDGSSPAPTGAAHPAEAGGDLEDVGALESGTGLEPSELLRLDGVVRSRFLPGALNGPSALNRTTEAVGAAFSPGAGSGRLLRPVDGAVTSPFGDRVHPVTGKHRHHDGVDLAAPAGTPIRAAEEGVVSFAGQQSGYGNVVIVDHTGPSGSFQTVYAHQSHIGVTQGERIARGEVIGAVGSTGVSTGPHLHFEVRRGGTAVDPQPYL
jgi:murein DD-endopeptidase MepM/ murein hydrolase activator NlpD